MSSNDQEAQRLLIADVRAAYQTMSGDLNILCHLTEAIKFGMVDVLGCTDQELEDFLDWLHPQGVRDLIYYGEDRY